MPRIRTIKPEFWQNESLATSSLHARLLAIALLNQADDKGYFLANHNLVRAACFPFEEDSKNVLGGLLELSEIGYIEIRNCDGKQIGRICKFLDHQRIDKPQKSKFDSIFTANCGQNYDSWNVPGIVLEESGNGPRPERKGKEGERNGKGKEQEAITADFQEVCDYWNSSQVSSKVRKLTLDRKARLKQRLQDPDWPWREAIDRLPIPNTPTFTWQPDFDWLIANERNAYSLVEGKYDRKDAPKQKTFAEIKQANTNDAFERVFGDGSETTDCAVIEGAVRGFFSGGNG